MSSRVVSSLAVPLSAAVLSWGLFMAGLYTDLFVQDLFKDGERVGQEPAVAASTYLFFAAVAVFALAALWGQRRAISERVAHGPRARPERSAHRFGTLALIVAMAIAAILAISTFFEGFGRATEEQALATRLGNVYAPILLYTALVVTVLLVGFVFRRDTLPKSSDLPEESDDTLVTGVSGQRDLGAAYAVPIVATAIALIAGLIVYDATGEALEVWVWVAIQAVIAAGLIAGTVFAERAVSQGPTAQSSRSRITRGARSLSFVLSIVFGAVVGIMGFGYGASAIDSLRIQPYFFLDILAGPNTPVEKVDVSLNAWDIQDNSSASITLEPTGTVLLSESVTDRDYFYETRPLPGNLEPGDYTLVAEGTSIDGRLLSQTIDFEVTDSGVVLWDTDRSDSDQWEQDNNVIVSPDGRWLIQDFLPAFVLIVLAVGTVYVTITERNRPARGLTQRA